MAKGTRFDFSRVRAAGLVELEKQWFYLLCQFATICAVVWWTPYRDLPWAGTSVAIIAFLAALMSVHPDIQPRHKVIYFSLMALLLVTEFRAMRKDREEARQTQNRFESQEDTRLANLLRGERGNTRKLLEQENKNLGNFLTQDQSEFEQTLTALIYAHKQDEKDFVTVVNREQSIVQSQQEMSEQFAGRLVPGDDPTPSNACSRTSQGGGGGDVTVILEDNAAIVNHFPATILEVGNTPVISVDKVPGSQQELALSADFRTKRNEIAIQVDKKGVVNRTENLILMHPNKSTFLIEDSFGREFFRAVYLNSNAFQVSGSAVYCGKRIPLRIPIMHAFCSEYSSVAIKVGASPCPTIPQ